LLTAAGSLAVSAASAQTAVITDNFEIDSSADYTIGNDGSIDGVQEFGFDYVAAGIPLAPRSAAGDTGGLRLTVNTTLGTQNAITCFHKDVVDADLYTMTVDVWMNFTGTAGTTEHAHVGVGGDEMTFNQLFSPISGSGAFIAFDGDGGSGSDYRWFRDPLNTPMGETNSTTLPNSHPSDLGNGSNNSGAFFQALFPSPPSTIGFAWQHLDDRGGRGGQRRGADLVLLRRRPHLPRGFRQPLRWQREPWPCRRFQLDRHR
jgi:hypothetical protein